MVTKHANEWKTAVYLRLSKEDGDRAESESIANQRKIIQQYLRHHEELRFVREYADDGYSGSNFDRPAFRKMCEDIEKKEINCVVVKDLSRFGRNYIESGRYIEHLFPMLGVRLIAINDGYDGAHSDGFSDAIMVPMKNLMNDSYVRDISLKIRSQLDARRKRGEFIANYAPYGYKKDPDDRNRLIIDGEAAENVRLIFRLKLEGNGCQGIADHMNRKGIPSPYSYRIRNGEHYSMGFAHEELTKWSAKAVIRILENEVYIGNLVQGKTKKINYRSRRMTKVPKQDQIRVVNTHEAVIDIKEWTAVQRLKETEIRISPEKERVPLFSGIFYCADCGSRMTVRTARHKQTQYTYYMCSGYKRDRSCSVHNISLPMVEEQVQREIREMRENVKRWLNIFKENTPILPLRQIRILENEKTEIMMELSKTENISSRLYNDYTDGLLDREEYMSFYSSYQTKMRQLRAKAEALTQKIEDLSELRVDREYLRYFLFCSGEQLTRKEVVCLIDRITVTREKQVRVIFCRQELFEQLREAENEENQQWEENHEKPASGGEAWQE